MNGSFLDVIAQYNFEQVAYTISGDLAYRHSTMKEHRPSAVSSPLKSPESLAAGVEIALEKSEREIPLNEEDLMALLSSAADTQLERMALRAREITRKRFGRVMLLYTPLYLSNECRSGCTYCGFSSENEIVRRTLTQEEALEEARLIHETGMRHILLLTGEDLKATPVTYIADVAKRLSPMFPSISIEVYPLSLDSYSLMRDSGVDGLTIYQETYDSRLYRGFHPHGMKSRMDYRLEAPERAGRAKMRRIAIGALLGLSDPSADIFFTALHARFLQKQFWQTQILIGVPRLRPASGVNTIPYLPDRTFARFLFALRLFLPDVGLVLSTRESSALRDALAPICITQMSAGSRTDPGGYSHMLAERAKTIETGEQFHIEDNRSVMEVQKKLESLDLEPLFLDWCTSMK